MSRAALAHVTESTSATPSKAGSSTLRVSEPDDAYEIEADRVADRVAAGGRIGSSTGSWSLAGTGSGAGSIQRDPDPSADPNAPAGSAGQAQSATAKSLPDSTAARPLTAADALPSLGRAFIATPAGQKILTLAADEPLAKDFGDFASTPAGIVIVGATAVGTIAAMAKAHQGLPLQVPQIPLDRFVHGMAVKIDFEGPIDHPTQGSVVVSFDGGSPKKKKDKNRPDARDDYRTKTERLASYLEVGTPAGQAGPGHWGAARREALPATPKSGSDDRLRTFGATQSPKPFGLLDRTLELRKSRTGPVGTASGKDEPLIQRKAEHKADLFADPGHVDRALQSSGQPLDRETRRFMESRIGFDFGRVRIHTDASAQTSARALGARAYTVGNEVVFASGRYAPQSIEGRRLLAHELTHVVQQSGPQATPHPIARNAPRQVQRWLEYLPGAKEKLINFLAKIPGYHLFTVILGRDLVTGDNVPANATNLIQGVLELAPGGAEAFQKLQQNNAIERTGQWISAEIAKLQFSEAYFLDLMQQIKDSSGASDLIHWEAAAQRIAGILKPPYERLKTFALNVADKVFEFVLDAAVEALGGRKVLDVLHKAAAAFGIIAKDPAAFLQHLLDALSKGFSKFTDNIVKHLENGVIEWLFGAIGVKGLTVPTSFTPLSIITFVLQVLDITWQSFKKRLVRDLGEPAVAFLEKAFDVVVALAGPGGMASAWAEIQKQAGDLFFSVIGQVRDWIIAQVVKAGLKAIITLSNPLGGLIETLRVIYETIKFFVDKAQEIADFVASVVDSIAAIAMGNIENAAQKIEDSLARTIPIILRFLAGLLGLGGISETIHDIVGSARARVHAAVDKVYDAVLSKGKALWDTGKKAVAGVVDWWKQKTTLTWGGNEHTLSIEGTEDEQEVFVASSPAQEWEQYLKSVKRATNQALFLEVQALVVQLRTRLPRGLDDNGKALEYGKRRDLFNKLAKKLVALGLTKSTTAPFSEITYSENAREDGGGTEAKAPILSKNHPPGTDVRDKTAPIWTDLGDLARKKDYVQGHLLNDNLGGQGQRYNLTPINKKANSRHLADVERFVKSWVENDMVVSYVVTAIYADTHKKPKRYRELLKLAEKEELGPKRSAELKTYKAEQRLVTQLDYDAQQLEFIDGAWKAKPEKMIDNKPTQKKGSVPHVLED